MKRVIVLLTFISIALCSFRIKNDTVVVEQVESDLPIIIRYDSVRDYIFRVQFPLTFRICNISGRNKQICQIAYYYKDINHALSYEQGWNYNVRINRIKKGELLSPYKRGRIMIDSLTTENFVFQTGHSIRYEDTTLQSVFRSFIPAIKQSGKDTLHISTIRAFKEKYPEIIKTLLQNDSIKFWIYTPWSDDKGIHFILPVEQK
ncbi:hypothetical protein ACPYIV_05490 [Parabacteroides sp. ASD2025]|uniref:hypothetical protein n=1 Tax=Parabacteroides sp. ASD2025 TaxID=3415987 RepID=UPI003CF04597